MSAVRITDDGVELTLDGAKPRICKSAYDFNQCAIVLAAQGLFKPNGIALARECKAQGVRWDTRKCRFVGGA